MHVYINTSIQFRRAGQQGPTRTLTTISTKYLQIIAVHRLTCHTATGTHTPYGIWQCYLPPGRCDIPAVPCTFYGQDSRYTKCRCSSYWIRNVRCTVGISQALCDSCQNIAPLFLTLGRSSMAIGHLQKCQFKITAHCYDTIRDATTWVILIYRTEPTAGLENFYGCFSA